MPIGPDNTAYTVVARDDGTYAVKITRPGGMTRRVEGFGTRAEAEDWIFDRLAPSGSELPSYAGPTDGLPGTPWSRR